MAGRFGRNPVTEEPRIAPFIAPVVVPVPVAKAKPNVDAVISVVVTLPFGEVRLKFKKRHVMSNNTAGQLSKANLERAFLNALEPVLGRVETVAEEKPKPEQSI